MYSSLPSKLIEKSLILQLVTLLCAQGVFVIPSGEVVVTLDADTTVTCNSLEGSINSIQWLINGTLVEPSAQVNPVFDTEHGIGLLQLKNFTLNFNSSRIQCRASFDSGITETSTELLLILVQGLLGTVDNLKVTVSDSNATLSWTAPFSLDIPDEDPDIRGYCVDVYRSDSVVNSTCAITNTRYSYILPPDSVCHIYDFTVTPVNVVGRGQINSATYSPQVATDPVVTTEDCIIMSAGVCSVRLTFVDLDTGESRTWDDLTIQDNAIKFTTEQLADNRHYNVTVNASNAAGSATTYVTISTHDILNATPTETDDDAIVITTLYSEHSDARGALFNFVFIKDNGDVNFTRSVLLALDRNTSLHHTLPFNLYPGQYRVFVYDIESDGTLSNGVGYPAVTNELILSSGNEHDPSFESQTVTTSCQITTSPGVISAVCTFPSDIMATGFQMIAQLNSSSEVHILHVSQSMGLQTPVTVEVEESGVYQVTILSITEAGIVGSRVEYAEEIMVGDTTPSGNPDVVVTIVVVLVVLIVVIMIILGVVIFMVKTSCMSVKPVSDEEMQISKPISDEKMQTEVDVTTITPSDDTQQPSVKRSERGRKHTRGQSELASEPISSEPSTLAERKQAGEEAPIIQGSVCINGNKPTEDSAIPKQPRSATDKKTHVIVYQEPRTSGLTESEEIKSEDVDFLVESISSQVFEQQREIGMKIGKALGLSDETLQGLTPTSAQFLREILIYWVKNKVATLRELSHALYSHQVGLTAIADELYSNISSQQQVAGGTEVSTVMNSFTCNLKCEAEDVDFLVEKIASRPWKKIGIALGSTEKQLDQKNPEQYLRMMLNKWLKENPTWEELARTLSKEGLTIARNQKQQATEPS